MIFGVNALEPDRDVAGTFEIHLTVDRRAGDEAGDDTGTPVGRLTEVAREYGLKFTHIKLSRGVVSSQPMFTATGTGTLAAQRVAAAGWVAALREAGLDVIRVKIEAAPWSTGIPGDDEQAALAPVDRYFEHHVKLLLSARELSALDPLVEPYHGHVSRNARRRRPDERHERFVTQRCHRVGQKTARKRLADLLGALAAAGYHVLDVEEEYVVYDDNLAVDAGWITPTETEPAT